MTDDEAIDLGQRAIYHATHRDAFSGGMNNVFLVKPEGWTQVRREDVNNLHYRYRSEAAAAAEAGDVAM